MKIDINFYGHHVTVHPGDIASDLDHEATDEEIKDAVLEDIELALRDEFPSWYSNDIDEACEQVRKELDQLKEDE